MTMERLLNIIQKSVPQLFMLVFIIAWSGAKAQYPYNFSYAGVQFETKTIVRNYDGQHAVVYYEENGKGYVSLVNVITYNTITVPLDTGIFINDMCIMNDSVFLCGIYKYTPSDPNYFIGCIVTINLNNFSSSSVFVTCFLPSYWISLNFKRIKKFEYTNGINYHAKFLLVCDIQYACDGTEPFPLADFSYSYVDINNHSMCTVNAVVEVSYPFTISFSGPFSSQRVIRVINPFEHSEIIHDVVVTDNYVAFVGVESGGSNSITLHICNKGNNILKSNYPNYVSDFDSYYTYSLGTSNGNPFYRACALDGDKIAIATQDETSTSSNNITVRTFDLTTHTMINTQELQCNSHPTLKDIAYIPDLHKVVLLFHSYFHSTYNYCDIFCTIDPYNVSSSFVTQGMTDNVFHFKFGSLDAMSGQYFISTGGKYGFIANPLGFIPPKQCFYVEDYNVIRRNEIGASNNTFRYDQYCPTASVLYMDTASVGVVIPFQCVHEK